jgi:hypothetical protein
MQQIEDMRKLGRILEETGEVPEGAQLAAGATAGGDSRRARGVPIVCRGVRGTAPGTDPLGELLRKEARGESRDFTRR